MSILPGLQFGSGILLASPQSSSGNPAPNPTPVGVGIIQNVKLTLGADIKTLFGQNQWPVDSAVGKRTIKGSFEFAQLSNLLLSQLFTGDSVGTGVVLTANNGNGEAHSIPGSIAYTVTIAPPGSGTYVKDFGVLYALTSKPFTNVTGGSLTAVGQYQVDQTTGVYTFYSGDASAAVLINYTYTATSGTTITAANHAMGYGPVLALNVVFPYESAAGVPSGYGFYFPNVRLGKIDLATKLDDYTMMTTDFEAFAGTANQPFQAYNAY